VRAFAVGSFAIVVWLVLEVAAFASQQSERIEERNMFYVAPLALVALLGLAGEGVVPARRRVLIPAACIAAVLPAFIPFPRFITTSAVSDTFALLPWWWIQDHWVHLNHLKWAALIAGVAAAVLFLLLPRRLALVLPALVGVYFVFTSFIVENGRHGIHLASVGTLWAGIRVQHPDWIDRAVGRDASVDYVWSGTAREYSIWENEFFNRSLRRVYSLAGPGADPLSEISVTRRDDGVLLAGGQVVHAQYVLADGSTDILTNDPAVAGDSKMGLKLYRVNGPVVVMSHVVGLYPNDTWSGRTVTYQHVFCEAGRLSVLLGSDPRLFTQRQTVVAREHGSVVGRAQIAPGGQTTLTIPLQPTEPGAICTVRFTVGRTIVPKRVVKGSKDDRPLGAHFLRFTYRP
jgi:hypothetical protein